MVSFQSLRTEYSDLGMTVEVVDSLEDAINHVNEYGSGHTDAIVTRNLKSAEAFCQFVDSACVFHNSTFSLLSFLIVKDWVKLIISLYSKHTVC